MGGGGAERQLTYLAGELVRLGWDVHVALVTAGPNYERLRNSGAAIHQLTASSNYDPRLLTQLLRTIGRVQPDLIQVWVLQMEVLGAIAATVRRIPWILSERSSAPAYPSSIKHVLRDYVGLTASAVVSNSPGGDQYWKTRVTRVPRYVIPNAVPVEEIERAPAAGETETGIAAADELVLFAGRLTHYKNPHRLLDALFPVITERNAHAIIAGDGPMLASLAAAVRDRGLERRVRMPGFVANLWSWMKRANVFVSPAVFEGHPNSVIEAMACGCPLVVSDIPAHRELLDEASALLVPLDDDARLTEAILEVLKHPEAAAARARRAARHASQWSIPVMGREYARVYGEVLANARS
jgi:glycosyltransferase involved in cell wall biosynthesis